MMADESDGVGETFDDSLRIALTIASQFGERISRLREQLARQREAAALQDSRELQARFDAERGAARAQLAVVERPEWWDRASAQNIADVHETATAWREHDDTAKAAAEKIRQEIRDRYGIDVNNPGANPRAVTAALEQAERDRAQAAEDRRRAGEERRRAGEDLTASHMLLNGAERRDRNTDEAIQQSTSIDDPAAAERAETEAQYTSQEARGDRHDSDVAYDSAKRREAFASSLEGTANEHEVRGRVLADTGNAKHPCEAVNLPPERIPRASKRAADIRRQRDRGGLTR